MGNDTILVLRDLALRRCRRVLKPSYIKQLVDAVNGARMDVPSRTHHVVYGFDEIEHRLYGLGVNIWISSNDFLRDMIMLVPLNETIWLYQERKV